MKNPLLSFSSQPFGTIPFKDLKNDHFIPAVTEGIKNAEITIDKISTSTEPPTFENTILPFELSGQRLNTAVTAYYHLFGSESDQELKGLAEKISPEKALMLQFYMPVPFVNLGYAYSDNWKKGLKLDGILTASLLIASQAYNKKDDN